MTTITHQECVYEEVQFDGDHVSGSFVVVDHGLAWNSGEEGVELVVSSFLFFHFFSTFFECTSRPWKFHVYVRLPKLPLLKGFVGLGHMEV